MAYTSEIEKLERRWKENPLGTAFAPLAEVYRKDGQLERARETLKQGLANNPNYIPGNIVLGRCCLDMKEDSGAEAAFSHVIELDSENVIALKALGDIAERQSRFDEATKWLNRLAQVDPTNEDARDQLKRIEATRESTAMVMAAQPDVAEVQATSAGEAEAIEPSITEVSSGEIHTGEIQVEGPEGLETEPVRGTVQPEAEPLMTIERQGVTDTASLLLGEDEDTVVVEAVTSAATSPPAFEESDLTPPATEEPLIEPSPYEPVSFSDYPSSRGSGADLGVEVFPVHAEEPAAIELRPSGHSEFQAPDDAGEMLTMRGGSSEFQEPDAAGELSLSAPVGGNEFQPPSGSEELMTAMGSGSEFQDISDPTRDLGSSASLEKERLASAPTEEMSFGAEPVAAEPAPAPQGGLTLIFPEDAGRAEPPRTRRLSDPEEVPVEPVQSEPEPVLTESMAEMYARQGLANEALLVYRQLAKRAPDDARLAERIDALETAAEETPGSRRPPFAASVTGGESVESFFSSLVASRPAAPGAGGGSAAPVRADEAEDDDKPGAPTRPASDPLSLSAIFGEEATAPPATPPAQPSASTPTTGHAFSFDQFFGAKDSGGGGQSAPSTRTSKPSGLEEDLDQFQHWLKSLKK